MNPKSDQSFGQKLQNFIIDKSIWVLSILFLVTVFAMVWQARRMQTNLLEETVLEQAEQYSTAMAEVRKLYSAEVVSRVNEHGIEVTHDYLTTDAAIPLPATFSILLGDRLGQGHDNAGLKIYSNYSFPWRLDGGPQDEFQRQAIQQLGQGINEPFYEFTELNGTKFIRYATADVMSESCVSCHNSHPDSPKKDWRVGDVRGILEISLPIEAAANSQSGVSGLMLISGLMASFILGTQFVVSRRTRANANKLEERVALRTTEMVAANQQLEREIEARKRIEEELLSERAMLAQRVQDRTAELSEANRSLETASVHKDQFLASMSHELRTPLNAILGMSEALQEEIYGPLQPKQSLPLRRIEESGRHLLDLINDILDVSKIESGEFELDIEPISTKDVCLASVYLVKPVANNKNIEITTDIDSNVLTVEADARRLKQILVNLLSNAVKFTPEGGRVGLRVFGERRTNSVFFMVFDSGIGISPDDMDKLFQPFVQLDSSLSRKFAGTGLGLTLVDRLTKLHGGEVTVESTIGQGSTFTIALPWRLRENQNGVESISAENRPPPRVNPYSIQPENSSQSASTPSGTSISEEDLIADIFSSINPDAPETAPRPMSSTLKKPAPQPKRAKPLILVAEDNEMNIVTLQDFLSFKGYDIKIAHNGLDAIEKVLKLSPDLVLMDIQMPDLDGMEAIRRLRRHRRGVTVPIIALTGLAMSGDRERCLEAGADDYLSKPFSLDVLAGMIEDQLKREKTPQH